MEGYPDKTQGSGLRSLLEALSRHRVEWFLGGHWLQSCRQLRRAAGQPKKKKKSCSTPRLPIPPASCLSRVERTKITCGRRHLQVWKRRTEIKVTGYGIGQTGPGTRSQGIRAWGLQRAGASGPGFSHGAVHFFLVITHSQKKEEGLYSSVSSPPSGLERGHGGGCAFSNQDRSTPVRRAGVLLFLMLVTGPPSPTPAPLSLPPLPLRPRSPSISL